MLRTNRDVLRTLIVRIASVPGLLAALTAAAYAQSILPPGAWPVGEPRLCTSWLDAEREQFTCQEYRHAGNTYSLLFKGGRVPRAIIEGHTGGARRWDGAEGGHAAVTDPAAPDGVPASAVYLGTGVCQDEDERAVPCRVFRYAAARDDKIRSYLVLYDPDGGGARRIEVVATSVNHDVLIAEVAFQLGSALLAADCCHARAYAYLVYARRLFPQAEVYRNSAALPPQREASRDLR